MKRLKELRNELNMSQIDLANILNISQQAISSYENNDRNPDIDTLIKMSKIFHKSIDYLLDNESSPTDEVTELLETLHKRPEMKALFSISKNATKADIEKTMKIIEALKEK